MGRRIIVALVMTSVSLAHPALAKKEPSPCAGLSGGAAGLCNAFCEAQDCDVDPSKHSCDVLRRNFERLTGSSVFPCEAAVPTATATNTAAPTASFTATLTATATSEATATDTPQPVATDTPLPPTATFTPIFTATATTGETATETPEPVATDTPLPPTATFTPIFTETATSTPESTATETAPPAPSDTPTPTATFTPIFTETATSLAEGIADEEPALTRQGKKLLHEGRTFVAHLSGDQEVPSVATPAQGQVVLKLSKDGTGLRYKLNVANLDGITQAHLHCGPVGVNGSVTAFLFGFDPNGVNVNGRLASGTITDTEVIPIPDSAACPGGIADLDDLVAQIHSGFIYANVHTLLHPAGEVRGQLEAHGRG